MIRDSLLYNGYMAISVVSFWSPSVLPGGMSVSCKKYVKQASNRRGAGGTIVVFLTSRHDNSTCANDGAGTGRTVTEEFFVGIHLYHLFFLPTGVIFPRKVGIVYIFCYEDTSTHSDSEY